MTGLKRVCVAVLATGLIPNFASASTTELDGTPVLFDQLLLGDFNDGTAQGWTEGPNGQFVGVTIDQANGFLTNTAATSGGDPQVLLRFDQRPDIPNLITWGNLPGQYDIAQFRLRLTNVPQAFIDRTSARGDVFFGGSGAQREAFYINDGTGMQAGDTVPELQTDGQFHTYTIQLASTDGAWGAGVAQIRIDAVSFPESIGTEIAIDDVVLGRSNNVQPYQAFSAPQFIENSSFIDVDQGTYVPTSPTQPIANVTGSFGDFNGGVNGVGFLGSNADLTGWTHFSNDPDGLEGAVGQPGVDDPGTPGAELNGTYYLDALWNPNNGEGRYVSNSAQNYEHGLVQSIDLSGAKIDPTLDYVLDLGYAVPQGDIGSVGDANSTITLALTDGAGAAATDLANSIAQVTSATVNNANGTLNNLTLTVTGADLLAAGDLNVVFSHVNTTPIPGFPGSVQPGDVAPQPATLVSQVSFLDLILSPEDAGAGDVNKDGVIDQGDVAQMQAFLAADAVANQTLLGVDNAADSVLAALNLTDFDLNGDDFFDEADLTALQALVALDGDFNGDGLVTSADYAVWRGSAGTAENATNLSGNGNNDGTIDGTDYQLWAGNYTGSVAAAGTATSAAVPEPGAALLLGVALLAGSVVHRSDV